jgi:nitrate/nitrite transport system ATP-binding protein
MSASATLFLDADTLEATSPMRPPARTSASPVVAAGIDLPAQPALELRGVSKGFGPAGARSEVLHNIDLTVADGEFLAIVGFSGSGKTTLVNLLAGFVAPDVGQALKKGQPIAGPGPDRGIVFQNYTLMPWLSVLDNVQLSVDAVFPQLSRAERRERTLHYVNMVGLSHAVDRRPAELSGGMRQRVSVARALAASPDVLLLDEPLSALDALTRAKLQDEIVRIWNEDKKTVILITNDVDEALIVADRIIPLETGPAASLGPAFTVDIERPRDRRAMNHDVTFRRLRHEITEWLMDAGRQRAQGGETGQAIAAPTLVPHVEQKQRSLASMLGMRHAKQLEEMAAAEAAELATPIQLDAEVAPHSGDERFVDFTGLSKIYPTKKGPLKVVDGFELKIKRGEFISIIGHSGCGKSTVLSMVAGLTDISEGGIILDGREVNQAGPDRGIVFQAPSLVPWLTARENVMLGVDRVFPHADDQERRQIAEYYLARVGLASAMDKQASDMSNGMRQRVGIARAFSLAPKLLLLDEPFGMLDSLTRWELQEVLMEVWARNKVSAIMVTHDVDEAILLADRVVMMTNGPNAKVGKILDIPLERPRTRRELLAHPLYYELRESLITFLEECDQH